MPSGTEKNTAARVTHEENDTRREERQSLILLGVRFFADGNFPAHSRISPTLTRFIITENNKLEGVLMVEVKIRPFSFLDKGKFPVILLSIIQHPFGVFTYFGDKKTTPVIVLSI